MYITIVGRCKECHTIFNAYSIKKPEINCGFKLFVKTTDTRGVLHTKKRALKGVERKTVGKDLLYKKAIT